VYHVSAQFKVRRSLLSKNPFFYGKADTPTQEIIDELSFSCALDKKDPASLSEAGSCTSRALLVTKIYC
jgi:hypothetical protein